MEQEQDADPTPPCPEGWREVDGKCVEDAVAAEQEETPTPPCPEGWREVDGSCVKNEASAEEIAEPDLALASLEPSIVTDVTVETPEVVAPDDIKDEPEPLPPPPMECGDGFHLEDGACVPDEEVTVQEPEPEMTPTPAAAEAAPKIRLPRILRLGEPFASYTDFADCVNKNPDKEDPEAYCASIKQKTEGETVRETRVKQSRDVYEHIDLLYNATKSKYFKSLKRDVELAECVNTLNRAVANIATAMPRAPRKLAEEIAVANKNSLAVKKHFNEKLGQVATTNAKQHQSAIMELRRIEKLDNKLYKQTLVEMRKLAQKSNAILKQLTQESTMRSSVDKQLQEAINAKTRDFEKILAYADKNVSELTAHSKTLEERIKDMEQAKVAAEKQVKETTPLMTRIENLEAKLRGQFKGKQLKPISSKAEDSGEQLGDKSPYK